MQKLDLHALLRACFSIEEIVGAEGSLHPIGTGFVVSESGRALTAKHNVMFRAFGQLNARCEGAVLPIQKDYSSTATEGADLALIRLRPAVPRAFPYIRLSSTPKEKFRYTRAYLLGYSPPLQKIIPIEQFISDVDGGKMHLSGPGVVRGMSGGPVLNEAGEAIGVLSSTNNDVHVVECVRTQGNLQFLARPADASRLPVAPAGVRSPNPLSMVYTPRELESLLADFQALYRTSGDPLRIHNHLRVYLDYVEPQIVECLPLANLYIFAAYLLINSEYDEYSLALAREHLDRAAVIIARDQSDGESIARSYIKMNWLLSITHKQEKNIDRAASICESVLDELRTEKVAAIKLLPLYREAAILSNDRGIFNFCRSLSDKLPDTSLERFHTLRRHFEHLVSSHDVRSAEEAIGILTQSYTHVSASVDKIYAISLAKNFLQLRYVRGDHDVAERLYSTLARQTRKLNLKGQSRSLTTIRSAYVRKKPHPHE